MSSNDEKQSLLDDTKNLENNNENNLANNVTESNNVEKEVPVTSKKIVKKAEASDQHNMKSLLGPMLDDIEKAIAENMHYLDAMEEDLLGDSKRDLKKRFESHVPEEIRERKSIDTILKKLETLIIETTESQLNPSRIIDPTQKPAHDLLQSKLQTSLVVENNTATNQDKQEQAIDFVNSKIGDLNNLACVAQSLTAFLITANSKRNGEKLKNLTIKLYDSVNFWLSRLFRFENSSVLFHDQDVDGFIRICNMLLNFKYKEYQKNGYESLKKQPIIYISAASKYAQLEYRELIAIQLGLPLSCIKIVKVSKEVDNTLDKIDLGRFLAELEKDVKEGFMPLIVVACAGSYVTGQCDDINQLNHICYNFKLWVHLEGIYLSTLALYAVPTELRPVSSGDSITLNLSAWLGIPSLSYVTLYRNVGNSGLYIQPFNSFITTLQRCLPYWCILQAIGHDGFLHKIRYANDMSTNVKEIVSQHKPFLKIMNFKDNPNPEPTTTKYSLSELFLKVVTFLTHVELNNPILIFKLDQKYINERLFLFGSIKKEVEEPKKHKNAFTEEFLNFYKEQEPFYQKDIDKLEAEKKAKLAKLREKIVYPEEIIDYTDTLTTWLCDLINSLHRNIEFELIEIESEGVCIRFSPFEHVNIFGTNQNDIKSFSQSLNEILNILDASIKCKSNFEREINEFKNLIPVSVPKWAGIGAVRYIPDYLIDKLDEINKYQQKKLKINSQKSESPQEVSQQDSEIPVNSESVNSNDQTEKKTEQKEVEDSQSSNSAESDVKSTEAHSETTNKENIENDQLLEKYIKEINDLNEQIVKKLQTEDGAFSSSEASDNLIAIKFGMVSDLEMLKKLACEVQNVGKEAEESSRFIETMSDLIRQGIEKANEDLKKESEQKIVQEGLLRQIPIVSGLFNWLAPIQPVNTTGRTFNLQSGKIASTETTYKYHMQVEETIDNSQNVEKKNSMVMGAESLVQLVQNLIYLM